MVQNTGYEFNGRSYYKQHLFCFISCWTSAATTVNQYLVPSETVAKISSSKCCKLIEVTFKELLVWTVPAYLAFSIKFDTKKNVNIHSHILMENNYHWICIPFFPKYSLYSFPLHQEDFSFAVIRIKNTHHSILGSTLLSFAVWSTTQIDSRAFPFLHS